ncbi:MAG: MBL fold metallo-hydrolase [Verrucomicrobiota bacterium]
MKIRFWGTQGSLPAPMNAQMVREKVFRALEAADGEDLSTEARINEFIDNKLPFAVRGTYGTNTSCIQFDNPGGAYMICDAGSGLRDLGHHLITTGEAKKPNTYHIFMTHLHWDHLQGFPFFVPAFIPGNRIIFHTYHEECEAAFRNQMKAPEFPVPFDALSAEIIFDVQSPLTSYLIEGFEVDSIEQNHPGKSYGYRFRKDGKTAVFSTDSEHTHEAYEEDYPFVDFFRDADLVIFDAQYTMADATFTKASWGHSSNVMGVELAARARSKRLAIFHHEPINTDWQLDDFLRNTIMYRSIYHQESADQLGHAQYPEEILLCYDGLEIEL